MAALLSIYAPLFNLKLFQVYSSKKEECSATMKTHCLILLLLILVSLFSGSYGSSENKKGVNLISPHFKVRKLGGVDVLDYHDAGPNPSHDPGKGKGGPKPGNINP
ncbi:hypothetical protein ACH5RR_038282 [Cinchona calisaya]|uniref:Transmembrane protein n=1 Tax=Cinchona calisaya TaxID=153742 RepID=A0ABD2Y0M0_9GENT